MVARDYSSYLALDELLSSQHPITDEHDEMLFIVIHQATELWLKLVIHELERAERHIASDELGPAHKALARVARVQDVLIESWAVLATMTPVDYLEFRGNLGRASGLQSTQYRALEFILGRRDAAYVDRVEPGDRERLDAVLARPSLYDEALLLLARRGLLAADAAPREPWDTQRQPSPAVVEAWTTVYRQSEELWDLYELAEKLIDLEHSFSRWRFAHYTTVRRIIGNKTGTGGTSGLAYLKNALDFVFFPELWEVRTHL